VHKISVSRDLLARTRDELEKLSSDKTSALEKVAQVGAENLVLRDLMGLIQSGYIAPTDALHKLSEFTDDPTRLQIYKQAQHLVMDTSFGTPVADDDADVDTHTPEQRLNSAIQNL
jgi:hypothetical protein